MRQRSTADLLFLMVGGTLCALLLLAVIGVAVIEAMHPEVDTDVVVNNINDVIGTLIGMLAGYLGGRTQRSQEGEK